MSERVKIRHPHPTDPSMVIVESVPPDVFQARREGRRQRERQALANKLINSSWRRVWNGWSWAYGEAMQKFRCRDCRKLRYQYRRSRIVFFRINDAGRRQVLTKWLLGTGEKVEIAAGEMCECPGANGLPRPSVLAVVQKKSGGSLNTHSHVVNNSLKDAMPGSSFRW